MLNTDRVAALVREFDLNLAPVVRERDTVENAVIDLSWVFPHIRPSVPVWDVLTVAQRHLDSDRIEQAADIVDGILETLRDALAREARIAELDEAALARYGLNTPADIDAAVLADVAVQA